MFEIINKLIKLNKTISTMESCTGGYIANSITNIDGSSNIFKYGAVTYSNEYKIKMGVSSDLIDKYSVYSTQIAKEMSKVISDYTNSNYGIGVTGKLKWVDNNSLIGKDDIVYISVYDKNNDFYITRTVSVGNDTREYNKKLILMVIIDILNELLV